VPEQVLVSTWNSPHNVHSVHWRASVVVVPSHENDSYVPSGHPAHASQVCVSLVPVPSQPAPDRNSPAVQW
jgi:hypothetical protein